MKILIRSIQIIQAVLKRVGSSKIKSRIWNEEFSMGKWDYLYTGGGVENPTENTVLSLVEKYCQGGSILDVGCGMGDTGLKIDVNKYRYYMGLDISQVAVEKAIDICRSDALRKTKNDFVVGDSAIYTPSRKYNVILFKESLYYINRFLRRKVLNRYTTYLKKDGVVIVRLCDRERFKNIERMIGKHFRVIEKFVGEGDRSIILVFR